MTRADVDRLAAPMRGSKRDADLDMMRLDLKTRAFKFVGGYKLLGNLWEQRRPVLDALASVPKVGSLPSAAKSKFSDRRPKIATKMFTDENLLSRAMQESLASLERTAVLIEETVSEARLTGAEITAAQRRISRNLAGIDRALERLTETAFT